MKRGAAWLVVRFGTREYGLAWSRVVALLRAPRLTRLPRAREPWCGLVWHRGKALGVVDLRERLHVRALPGAPACPWAVVVSGGDRLVAVAVDGVWELRVARESDLGPPPPGAALVAGSLRLGARRVWLLDTDQVLAAAGAEQRQVAT